jgi:hypothetical protein
MDDLLALTDPPARKATPKPKPKSKRAKNQSPA